MFEDDDILALDEDELEEKEKEEEETPEEEVKDMDDDVLKSMMMTGENSEGTFTPDEELDEDEETHEEIDEDAEIITGKVREQLGKYSDELLFDMKENPDKYMVETPEGKMSLMDAIKKGWNPATKEFDGPNIADEFKEGFDGLNDADRQALQAMTDPSAAHIPPDEAAMYGLGPEDPMIDGQRMDPNMMQQPGGMPPGMGDPNMGDPNMGGPNMGGMGGIM